jgi:hypothetical protein
MYKKNSRSKTCQVNLKPNLEYKLLKTVIEKVPITAQINLIISSKNTTVTTMLILY